MTTFVLLAAAMCMLAAACLTRPLWRSVGAAPISQETPVMVTPSPRATRVQAAVLALFLFGMALGGYRWLGAPGQLDVGPGASAALAAEPGRDGSPPGTAAEVSREEAMAQVVKMVDQLVERLKTNPGDADGWQMLARSYAAMGKHAQALDPYAKATQLRPNDAALLADYAFAVAMANHRTFTPQSSDLVERALKAEPTNPRALALAGSIAFDRKDYRKAVAHWEALAQVEPTDSPFAQQIRDSIVQARQLAGMPAAAPADAASAAASGVSTAATMGRVSGTVSLAPALKARVGPDDIVFVFARAVGGSRMPLAIVRKRAKDLPFPFTLDDSMAMSPAAKLSSASKVIVGARISKSGQAMPQTGDLQGLASDVEVGASGVAVEISEEIGR